MSCVGCMGIYLIMKLSHGKNYNLSWKTILQKKLTTFNWKTFYISSKKFLSEITWKVFEKISKQALNSLLNLFGSFNFYLY